MRLKVPSNPNHSEIRDHQRVQPCQEQHPGKELLCCSIHHPTPQTGSNTPGEPHHTNPPGPTDKQKEFPLPSACHGEKKNKQTQRNRTNREFGDAQKHRPRGKRQRCSAHRLNSGTVRKNASSAGGAKILAQSRISPRSWVVD